MKKTFQITRKTFDDVLASYLYAISAVNNDVDIKSIAYKINKTSVNMTLETK